MQRLTGLVGALAAAALPAPLTDHQGLPAFTLRRRGGSGFAGSATCFRNNPARTHYAAYEAAWLPMGSGVTEAGCKLPVKKRLCGPGMSLGFTMAGHILRLRVPAHNTGQLWRSPSQEILIKSTALSIKST